MCPLGMTRGKIDREMRRYGDTGESKRYGDTEIRENVINTVTRRYGEEDGNEHTAFSGVGCISDGDGLGGGDI